MRIEDAKIILDYAADIPKKLRAIAEEQAEIEAELSCLRGIEYSGMPHGSGHSDSTADLAEKAEERGYTERLHDLEIQKTILQGDSRVIWEQIWTLNDVYRRIIKGLWMKGHSFEEMANEIDYSVSHTKRKKVEALVRMAEALEWMPMAEEIRARAYNARK